MGISFKIPGRVIRRLVDEGEKVHKDQLIAVLDTADLEAQAALQGRVGGGAGGAGRTERRLPTPGNRRRQRRTWPPRWWKRTACETELGRSRRLFEGKMISQEEYDRAAAAAGVAAERYRQASEQFKLVKAGPRKEANRPGPGARRAGGGRAPRRRGATGLCRGPLAPGRHRALQEHRAGGIRGPRHARGHGRRHGERLAAGVRRRDGP